MASPWAAEYIYSNRPRREHVDDIEESLRALLDAGAEAHQRIRDVGGVKLIASARDADGNIIYLLQSP
jgi:predicted enzyme related to lactoylglutathione lyase